MWKKILVPVDGSTSADEAYEFALDLASRTRASLVAMTVVDVEMVAGIVPETPTMLAQLRLDANTILLHAGERAIEYKVPCETTVVFDVDVIESIVGTAKKLEVDAIVMGTHGRSGFARAVMGSVAEGVLRKAECAVLAIRPARHKHAAEPAARS